MTTTVTEKGKMCKGLGGSLVPPILNHRHQCPSLTISSNDLEIGVFFFDILDHIDLENGVALGRVLRQKGGSN